MREEGRVRRRLRRRHEGEGTCEHDADFTCLMELQESQNELYSHLQRYIRGHSAPKSQRWRPPKDIVQLSLLYLQQFPARVDLSGTYRESCHHDYYVYGDKMVFDFTQSLGTKARLLVRLEDFVSLLFHDIYILPPERRR